MFKFKVFILFLILFFFKNSSAVVYIEQTTEKLIKDSELIVRGFLEHKSTNEELHTNNIRIYRNNGSFERKKIVAENAIMTTYTIKVSKILYGDYENKEIQIKMEGGCYEKYCLEIGTNYDLNIGTEYIIFLKFDDENNSYISSAHAYSAFELLDDQVLKRMTESIIPNIHDKVIREKKQQLNLHVLGNLIDNVKEKEK